MKAMKMFIYNEIDFQRHSRGDIKLLIGCVRRQGTGAIIQKVKNQREESFREMFIEH